MGATLWDYPREHLVVIGDYIRSFKDRSVLRMINKEVLAQVIYKLA